jgi:hypothetical protein
MKLTTTRNLIVLNLASTVELSHFDKLYPNIDSDQEVPLLDLLDVGCNIFTVVSFLCATVQDSKTVSVELTKRCAEIAEEQASDINNLGPARSDWLSRVNSYVEEVNFHADMVYKADTKNSTRHASSAFMIINYFINHEGVIKLKQDLIELLS